MDEKDEDEFKSLILNLKNVGSSKEEILKNLTSIVENAYSKQDLEKQFQKELTQADGQINSHLMEASRHLKLAIQVAEDTGIPFVSGISFLRNTYIPRSFDDKWKDLDIEFLEEQEIYNTQYGWGWQHSAVC